MSTYARLPAIIVTVAALVAGTLAFAGLGQVALWSVSIVGGYLALVPSLSRLPALAIAIAGFFGVELLLLLVTPHLRLGGSLPDTIWWSALSLGFATVAFIRPARRPNRRTAWTALAGSASAIVLVAVLAIAQLIGGVRKLAWAMNGDAVNAMGFARRMLADGGIDPSSTPQPTPLPFAMSAVNMEGGRGGLTPSMLLEHDVIRTSQVWVFVIVLSCLLIGAIIAHVTRSAPARWALAVVALASSIGLSWYVIGVQFDFGFMNSAFAVVLLLSAWLVFASGAQKPTSVLLGLFASSLGLLAVWSPLVVCIVGLAIVTVAREWMLLRRARPSTLVAPVVTVLVVVAYAATVTLPGFLQQSSALGSNGGFPAIGPGSILVIAALAVLASGMVALSGDVRNAAGSIAVVAGFALGLAYLLWQRKGADFGWGYYPAKFAWTASILLIVMITASAVRLLNMATLTRNWRIIMNGITGLVIVGLLWGPVLPSAQVPLAGVIEPSGAPGNAAAIVFDLAGSQNGRDVLWRTTMGDFRANNWLLQIDQPDGDPVKIYATVPMLAPDQMCAVIAGLGDNVVVHSSDPAARAELTASCPDAKYTLVEGEY